VGGSSRVDSRNIAASIVPFLRLPHPHDIYNFIVSGSLYWSIVEMNNSTNTSMNNFNNIIQNDVNSTKFETRPRANAITTKNSNSNVYGLSMNNWNKYIARYKEIHNIDTLKNQEIINTLFVDLNNKKKHHTLRKKLKQNNMNLTNKPNIKDITNIVKRLSNEIEKKREENAAKTKKNKKREENQAYLAGKISTELAPPVITKLNNYAKNGKIYNSLMQNIGKITPNIDELIRYIGTYSNEIPLDLTQKFRLTKLHEYGEKISNLWKNVIEKNKSYFDTKITKDEIINVLKRFLEKIKEYKDKFNCKGGNQKARQDICKKFDVCIRAITEIIESEIELINQLKSILKKIKECKDKSKCEGSSQKARQDICKKFDICIRAITEIIDITTIIELH
jgi:hypothetical protein